MGSTTDQCGLPVRSRVAVFGLFASFGIVIATWAVHLPSIKQTTGSSTAALGTILLVLGAGAVAGMQISGLLVDRFTSKPIAVLGVATMAVTLVVPMLAATWITAAGGALLLGLATGIAEVGMNAAAVEVERDYRRPIMASFHAVYSIGNVTGALVGAAGFALGVGVFATTVAVSVCCLIVVCVAAGALLGRNADSVAPESGPSSSLGHGNPPSRGRVFVLGVIAFFLMLAEGAGMDWSSLHAQQHLGAAAVTGSLALGCFVSAMTVGRFSVDRLAGRIGPTRVVRWGSVTAAVGLTVVMASPTVVLTMAGWTVLGLGLAGGIPQVFTAAGNAGVGAGTTLSRVVGAGYLAVLAGPGVIGGLADLLSLNTAFLLPLCGLAVCACTARVVSAPSTSA